MQASFRIHETLLSHPLLFELQQALNAVFHASQVILDIRQKGFDIRDKGGNGSNPVTEADEAASATLITALSNAFPDDVLISEEASIPELTTEKQRIWFIDPIDGTKEFINGNDEWSIMVGLSMQGVPVLGIVYQPAKDYLYYALQNGGAYFSTPDQKVKQIVTRKLTRVDEAIIAQSRSHFSEHAQQIAKALGITQTIQYGSLGLKLGLISRGIADIYINDSKNCHLWDVCGPEVILREAGGIVLTADNRRINYHTTNTLIKSDFIGMSDELFNYKGSLPLWGS